MEYIDTDVSNPALTPRNETPDSEKRVVNTCSHFPRTSGKMLGRKRGFGNT